MREFGVCWAKPLTPQPTTAPATGTAGWSAAIEQARPVTSTRNPVVTMRRPVVTAPSLADDTSAAYLAMMPPR